MTAIIFNNMCTDFKRNINKKDYLFMKAKANVSSTMPQIPNSTFFELI